MAYKDFMTTLHKKTERDYLARVNDIEFPKAKAATLAKKWDFDYWDGDRKICYGGYNYIPGRFKPVAEEFINFYGLKNGDTVLDVGCGKGFLLYEMKLLLPELKIKGIDISKYAIKNSKPEINQSLENQTRKIHLKQRSSQHLKNLVIKSDSSFSIWNLM